MKGDQLQLGDDERSIALRRAWDRALHTLASSVNKVTFESYIRPIKPLALDDREIVLGVASPFAREWLDKRYSGLIRTTLELILGCPVTIRFQVLSASELARQSRATPAADPTSALPDSPTQTHMEAASNPRPSKQSANRGVSHSLPLNDRYTFANFIEGKSNRLALASAVAVADSPGTAYNPLFIYGSPGLGKTHVLHAIGHAVRERDSSLRVALIDGENFTYQFVTALRERKTEEFKRHFRSIDVWLVDDIQFIAGKEQTKEEFFHTFNALYQARKQIILASDRSPRDLRTMDERLRSRFECGLIADIAPPDLETRMAILDGRCAAENWTVSREVIYYIASMIRSNIRALEGALTKLIAYSSIMHAPISIDLAQSVLGEYLIERPMPGAARKGVPLETILAAVSAQFNIPIEAIRGPRRDKPVVLARQVAMYLCREITGTCLAQIGAAIGNRDHTTIQRGIARIESLLNTDPELPRALQQSRDRLER